jgi:hypothetical protein
MIDSRVRKIAFFALAFAQAASAFAFTVSVSPAESGNFAPDGPDQASPMNAFVSGCMDALFESGSVVTDTAIERLDRAQWEGEKPDLREAKEGYVDYMIRVYVDWKASTFHKDALLPAAVSYRILRVSDGAVLGSGELAGIADSEESSKNAERSASLSGKQAVAPFVALLSTLSGGN